MPILSLIKKNTSMEDKRVDPDVRIHVEKVLQEDLQLRTWDPTTKEEILEALVSGAKGMYVPFLLPLYVVNISRFRWVVCQLDTLRQCLRRSALLQALKDLPQSLDETYDRILLRIPAEHREDVQTIFSLLAFSTRPISLEEAAEAVAINLKDQLFDSRDRLRGGPSCILEICSSLVTTSSYEPQKQFYDLDSLPQLTTGDSKKELQFAHYSVKEYLMSDRVSQNISSIFHLHKDTANCLLAHLSLIYLVSIEKEICNCDLAEAFTALPFFKYACQSWYMHTQLLPLNESPIITRLLSSLFSEKKPACLDNALRVANPESKTWRADGHLPSFQDFRYTCNEIMAETVDIHHIGGECRNALQVASFRGHESDVRLLLESGADINAQEGTYGNALQAASVSGHESVVRLLLESGADINAQGEYESALQAASFRGHESVVRLLLESGADINTQGGYESALHAASFRGHESVVRLLLESGAEIDARGGRYGNALRAALYAWHVGIIRLLLEFGAVEY
jgi:Ankyrin repeats (3 copies)